MLALIAYPLRGHHPFMLFVASQCPSPLFSEDRRQVRLLLPNPKRPPCGFLLSLCPPTPDHCSSPEGCIPPSAALSSFRSCPPCALKRLPVDLDLIWRSGIQRERDPCIRVHALCLHNKSTQEFSLLRTALEHSKGGLRMRTLARTDTRGTRGGTSRGTGEPLPRTTRDGLTPSCPSRGFSPPSPTRHPASASRPRRR